MPGRGWNVARNFYLVVLSLTAALYILTAPIADAQTAVTPAAVNFGNVAINETSAVKQVALKNTGTAAITVTSFTVPAGSEYALVPSPSTTCTGGGTLAHNATCTIGLTLTPASVGAQPPGTLTINTTASNPTQTVTLTGTGVNPTTVSAAAVAFGNVVVNETSAIHSFTLKNNQLTALGIASITPPAGGYAVAPSTTCGSSLAAGATCTVALTLTPTALGAVAAGNLTIATTSPSQSLTVALTGTGVNPTTVSATAVAFGNVVVNETGAIHSITLKNNQLTALGIASITPPAGGYAVAPSTTCGSSLAAGATCTLSLTLTPAALGAVAAGNLTIATTSPTQSLTVALTGTGVNPTTVSATAVAFGNVVVNETSATRTVTVKNNQLVPLNFTSIPSVAGSEFAIIAPASPAIRCTNSAPLAAGASCAIPLTLTPSAAPGGLGAQADTLTIVTDAGGTQTVHLTGTGIQPVTISRSVLTFPATLVGNTSGPLTVKVSNSQNKVLHFTPFPIAGSDPGDFAWTSTGGTACGSSIPAGGSCMVAVTFTPIASGARQATLEITDDSSSSPHIITLSSDGNATVGVTPSSITNFSASVGTTSHSTIVTIKNNNTVPANTVTISSFQTTGDFITTPVSCSPLPFTLAGGASCTIAVQFAPTIGGTRTGQLQVNDSALTSPQVVNLSGNGIHPLTVATNPVAINPPNLIYPAQPAGTVSTPKSVTLSNNESQSETFTLQLAGDYTLAGNNCSSGLISSGSINAHSSCVIAVNFSPAAAAANGPDTGTLTITDTAPGAIPLLVSLTGSVGIPQPAVAEITPGAGAAGTSVPVRILGNGYTHFSASSVITFVDTSSSTYPADITVSGQTRISANEIDATLNLGTPATNSAYGARNITIKTPLTGGGTETAFLNSAFTIYDPTNAHTITVVNPDFGAQGQTLDVGLSATGTNWVQGVTFFNFGTGITVDSVQIMDPHDAMVNISISNTTTVGTRTIIGTTGGEYASSAAGAFQVNSNSAALLSVNPNIEPQGFSGQLTLTASGTHFQAGATTVTIGGGVIVGAVNVTGLTSATVQVAVPANASIGPQNVTVATGGEIASLPNGFTVTGSTPGLVSIVPDSGQQGQTNLSVTITGNAYTNFAACSPLSVDMAGEITVGSVTPATNSVTFSISISPYANVGGITGNLICGPTGSATLFPFGFAVTPSSASIVSVTPNNVPQGGQVTLTLVGSNTTWTQAQTTAAFYPEPIPTPIVNEIQVPSNSTTNATLNITVPTNAPVGNYPFYLATGGQVVSSSIHVYANTPSMTMSPANGLVPSSGVNSFSVSFGGQFTNWAPGCGTNTSTVPVISGEGVTLSNFCVTSPVSAIATLSIAAGAPTNQNNPLSAQCGSARVVTFTTGAQIDTTCFNVTTTPVGIISVNPSHMPQGVTTPVTIVGLNTHFCDKVITPCPAGVPPTTVQFGPEIMVGPVNVIDNTHLTVSITTNFTFNSSMLPTTPGYQTVYVNTGNEQVTGSEQVLGSFSVDPPASPALVSVVPSSAPQGSSENVTITGSLTNWCAAGPSCPNPTEAILGAGVTVANLVITSATTATATISVSPSAPVGGNNVTMITGSEIVGGTGFSVTPSAAYIASVEPNFTCPAQATANTQSICGNGGGAPTGVPVVGQLQTLTLNIIGVGTHWLQGGTTLSFGSGVAVDSLTINSPTTATAQITVLSSAPIGFATASAITDGEDATLQQAIDIESGFPALLAISPADGEQGASMNLQVLGRFTHWDATTHVAFNQDITVNSVTVIDSQNLVANITVSPLAYVDYGFPCGHVLTVTTTSANEQVSTAPIQDNYCVSQGAEEITSISSLSGAQGSTQTVTITGSATNFVQGETTISFGDPNFQVGVATVINATTLTVPVAVSTAATPGFKTVTVTTLGQVASQQYAFTVLPTVAQLTEANPFQAEQGQQLYQTPAAAGIDVVLTGQYTHFSSASTATFGPGIVVNSVSYQNPTQVTANITIDPLSYPGGRTVTVTTPNVSCANQPAEPVPGVTYQGCTPGNPNGSGSEIVSANAFSIIQGPAIISNVSPSTGNEGQEVVFNLTGTDTHWQQNFTQFYIAGGGQDLTIHSVIINSPTSATVDMTISPTAHPGARSLYMQTAGESLTDSGAFVVTGGIPAIANIDPGSGQQGNTTPIEFTIHGIYTLWAPGTTTVNFGPGITASNVQVDDNFNIEGLLSVAGNATPGYHVFTVTTTGLPTGTQVLSGNFLVTAAPGNPGYHPPPAPYISYFTPSSGLPGQTFNISFTGQYTQWDPNPVTGTQCSFGSGIQVNSCQVLSQTGILANITILPTTPAQTNLVVFTTPSNNNETESVDFSVVEAVPTLTIVDPGSGMQGDTDLTVNILGQYTLFDSSTTFNFGSGITVNSVQILGPTIATATISINQLATLGGRSVVATTSDTPGGPQVVGGASFSVTASLAEISAVMPNTAQQGASVTVTVTGSNTHWNGSTVFSFGDGITVSNTNVTSNTSATLTVSVPALAAEGPTYASAETLGEIASLNNAFVVTAGTPYLLSSGPSSLPQQSSATFTILSQATNWTQAAPPTVSFGAGVTVGNVTVTSPTSLTVLGSVQATTPVGYRDLTVTNGNQVLSLANAFYVSPGPAVINSVTPNTGGQGMNLPAVQIVGTNTNWAQGVTTLTFPGVLVNSFTVNTPTSITANITPSDFAQAGQVSVTATTQGEVATGVNVFDITQTQAQLLAVVPGSAPQGWTTQNVTLTGLYTHFCDNVTTSCPAGYMPSVASFGAGITVNSVTANSLTSLVANVTVQPVAALGSRNVSVITGSEGVQIINGFNVTLGPAAISALSPASGGQNSTATILVTGSQTHFNGNAANGPVTTASFGGGIVVTGITVVDIHHANVSISIPNGVALGNYDATLTTGAEVATILGGFQVTGGTPVISSVNPPTGTQGTTASVTLIGLYTHFCDNVNTSCQAGYTPSVASFGAGITVNSTIATSSTTVVANITISPSATVGSRNVTVSTNPETAAITGGFSVLAGVAALVSAMPASAQAGATANVVIDGAFTTFQQNVSSVSFGAGVTVNSVTVGSATQLTANITVDPNATPGSRDITVTTNSQNVTLSGGFNVTPGTPVITLISPNIGVPSQTLTVTINGQYTNWVQGVTKASFGPQVSVGGAAEGASDPVTVSSANTLTATLTIDANAAFGPVSVIVTTGTEVESVPAGFTVQPMTVSPPTVVSTSPANNSGGVPINSNVIVVFSQPMSRATVNNSNVVLYLSSSPGDGQMVIPGNVSLDASGLVMTFTPASPLAVNSQFYLLLTGGLQDASGNAFQGNGYYYFNTAFTANTKAPTVIAANPPANAGSVGTNVSVDLEFSTVMDQATQTGLTVSSGGSNVAGSWSWNSTPCYYYYYYYYNCYYVNNSQLDSVLSFTPAQPLQPNTTYMVSYGAPLADTAGNAVVPGSFTFTTGTGADTAYNSSGFDTPSTSVGTNFVPRVYFSKPINPIAINPATLFLYNTDSGKYLNGTVTVAPDGMSASFTPFLPLLPNTAYTVFMSSGYYDMDGNYTYGSYGYFTTRAGAELAPPQVASIFPANVTTSVPLNTQIVAHFSEAIDPSSAYTIQVTPAGGAPIPGTATLASDQVTLSFVPTNTLRPGTQFTVHVSGFVDFAGNAGSTFTSTFTTATSVAPLILSTGLDGSGNLITTGDTPDAHWVVTPSGSSTSQPLLVETYGQAAFYGGFLADGPSSSWIAINPDNATGNDSSSYSTTFNLTGYNLSNLCLVGSYGLYPYGILTLNGTPLTSNTYGYSALIPLSIALPQAALNAGSNTLSLQWTSSGYYYGGFRLQGSIQTCGATLTGGLTLVSSDPASGSTSVATNSPITLTFNNPIDPATVNASTLPVLVNGNSGYGVAGSYQVSGNQVVFTPDSPFPVNTTIYVDACNGPYDTAGDSAGGCNTYLMSFTTGGTAVGASGPFKVLAFSPASGATGVGLRAPVVATFNRSVNPATINTPNIDAALFNGDSQSPWCTSYSKSQDNSTLQFNCYPLPASSILTAALTSNLQDFSGDALVNFSSQFTTTYTDSSGAGAIVAARPGTGSGGISANSPIVLFSNLPIAAANANAGLQVAQNNAAIPGTVQVLDNGYTLEFTPSSPFTPGALIQWFTTSSLTDATYGNIFTANSGYFYVAADTSTLAPAVQVTSPADGASVATNSIFDVQFNTPLNPSTVNSTNVYLYDYYNGVNIAATYTMPQPNEVRIAPSAALPASDYFLLNITSGLQSTTSVPATPVSGFTNYFTTGTSADSTVPAVVSAVPYNGAMGVGVNVQPGVVFNKAIDPVSVNGSTLQVTQGGTPLAGSYWISSDDTRVEFVPNAPLPAGTTLAMSLNGVIDQTGNPVSFTSHFQTGPGPDVVAPTIVTTSVASGGSTPVNSAITVQFSESMDITTFNSGNFYIVDTLLNTTVPATLSWSPDQSTAYLLPSSPFAAGREYYLYLRGGTDLAGNGLQPTYYSLYFYAELSNTSTAPAVTGFNPLRGATGLGTNVLIEAQFSEPVDANTLSGVTLTAGGSTVAATPYLSAGNTVLQLLPQAPLAPGTTYLFTIAGVKDAAGNPVSTATNSFTTGATFDLTPPALVNYDPPNYATVGTNVTPKLVFSKPLNPLTVSNGTFTMYLSDTNQFIPLATTLSADGMSVTLQPQIPLLPSTYYRYRACCGYQDQDGNGGPEIDLYFYTGSGAVTAGPTVTVSPIPGATGIPLNAQVLVTASTTIDPTSWSENSIQLLDNHNNPVAGTVSLTGNQTLTFVPTNALLPGVTYTVKVAGFNDTNGNPVVPSITTFTTGGAASTTGLTFTSSNITPGATGVPATQAIVLTFSQILDPTTVNSSTLPVQTSFNGGLGLAGTYVVNGNAVTFTPASPYPAGSTIYAGECGGPTDVLGDVFDNGNCWQQQLVYFTVTTATPDTTPLQVMSVSPANGAVNVRPDMPVSVTFNKSINPGTAGTNTHNAQLYAGQSLQANGSITMSADNRTLTFNAGALTAGTTYTIALPANAVTDMSGNPLASTFTSSFTTGTNPATGAGSVQSANPASGASGVPTDTWLTLYMNRPVNTSTLQGNLTVTVNGQIFAGSVQAAASGYEIEFIPSVPFPSGATIQWFFAGNVLDVNGDAFSATSGYFSTAGTINPATAQPQLVALSPAYYSSNVPVNAQVDIEYSLPIDAATLSGNVVIYDASAGVYPAVSVSLASPDVIRLIPGSALNPGDSYYVCVNSSVLGTNGVATQGNCWESYFFPPSSAVNDTTPGTVRIGPPNHSTNIGTNAYIRLQFSKPVDVTTITPANVAITIGGTPVAGSWSYNYSSYDAIGADFTPVNPLPPSTSVQVSVSGLLDYAGNTFAATSAQFTTGDLPDYSTPTVSFDFPYGQTGVATNASFTCRYSAPMDPSSITPGGVFVYSYATAAAIPVNYTFSSDLMSVTMTPKAPLAAGGEYSYSCSGAIDLTGNAQSYYYGYGNLFYAGSGPSSAGPVLLQANPPNGATNVPLNSNGYPWGTSLQLLFNEPVAVDSLNSITLTPQGGSPIPISISPEFGDTIAAVQLPYLLQPNTVYTYNVTGVTDVSGNPITPVTSTFTIGSSVDYGNPAVVSSNPVNGATNVDVNAQAFSITFSEAMDPVLVNPGEVYLQVHNTQTVIPASVSISPDDTTITVTPAAPLAGATIYDLVYYPNDWYLTDIAGNPSYTYGVISTFTTNTPGP